MHPPLRLGLIIAGFTMLLAFVLADVPVEPPKNPFAADAWKLPEVSVTLKAAPGVELVNANCILCHSLDYVSTQPPLTRAQWTAGVEKMRAKFGAPLLTNQVSALVEYLVSQYGKAP